MSLLDYLNRLQQSPVQTRKIALVLSVTVFMAIIIGLWILELRAIRIPSASGAAEPFRVLWDSVRNKF